MTGFPNSPRLLKAGLVLVDTASGQFGRSIVLQYNPDALKRSLTAQSFGEGAERSQALRLKGPPVETIQLEADLDASDQLEFPDQNASTVASGLYPQLAALELLLYPSSGQLQANESLAGAGQLEIVPMETPLTLFVWSRSRVVPVRITEFSVSEDAFDPQLNPIRAKVSLGLRVLSVDDLGFSHVGGGLFMSYLRAKEQLAAGSGGLAVLGL